MQGLPRSVSVGSPREGMLRGLEERLGLRASSSGGSGALRGDAQRSGSRERGAGPGGRARGASALERHPSTGSEQRLLRAHHGSGGGEALNS